MGETASLPTMFSVLLGASLIAAGIGGGVEYFLKPNLGRDDPWQRLFVVFSTGNIVITCVGAIVATKGATITIVCGFVALALLYLHFSSRRSTVISPYVAIPVTYTPCLVLSLLLLFLYKAVVHERLVGGVETTLNSDQWFYARLVRFVLSTGIEGAVISFDSSYWHNTIYHWGDIWHAAVISQVSGLAPMASITVVSQPLLMLNAMLGCAAIVEKTGYSTKVGLLLTALFSAFASGFSLWVPKYGFAARIDWYLSSSISTLGKLCFPAIVTNLVILTLLRRSYAQSILLSMLSVALYTPLAFSLAVSLIIVGVIDRTWKKIGVREMAIVTTTAALITLYLIFLYAAFGATDARIASADLVEPYFSAKGFRTFVNVFAGMSIQAAAGFAPLLVLMLMSSPEKLLRRRMFALFAAFCFGAVTAYTLVYWIYDAVQFYTLLFIPLLSLATCLTFAILSKHRGPVFYAGLCVLGVPSLFEAQRSFLFSNTDQSKAAAIRRVADLVGDGSLEDDVVYLKGPGDYRSLADKIPALIPLPELQAVYPKYDATSLSVFATPYSAHPATASFERSLIQSTPFYKFVTDCRKSASQRSIEELQVSFIRSRHVRWLFYPDAAMLPPGLAAMADGPVRAGEWSFARLKTDASERGELWQPKNDGAGGKCFD